jgi:calcineurin-like phosphoesterase family protein
MGMRFKLEHASLVAWLSKSQSHEYLGGAFGGLDYFDDYPYHGRRWMDFPDSERDSDSSADLLGAPRTTIHSLREFLEALPYNTVPNDGAGKDWLRRKLMLCEERLWQITNALEGGTRSGFSEQVGRNGQFHLLSAHDVANVLNPIRRFFGFPIYFMPLGYWGSLSDYGRTPEYSLWLLCGDDHREQAGKTFWDPFPPVQEALKSHSTDRITVGWLANGTTFVVPYSKATPEQLAEISSHASPLMLMRELGRLAEKPNRPAKHILHISDLHFGAKSASLEKIHYVQSHLTQTIKNLRNSGDSIQVVMTGDAMDSPKKKNLDAYQSFAAAISEAAGAGVVQVPGNHDCKTKGFVPNILGAPAVALPWNRLAWATHIDTTFVCFDTSKDTKLAQGEIHSDQFLEAGSALINSRTKTSNRIALVHHHPFTRNEDEKDIIPFLGIKEERWLRMRNGEQLVSWCVGNSIGLILHGHKHHPRFIGQEIESENSTALVRAIGCGSTLGAEGKPLSYNLLTFPIGTSQWSVTYLSDPGDGSGFKQKRIDISASLL